MKRFFFSLIALCAIITSASAADALKFFAVTGTDIGATNCHAIVSANGVAPIAKLEYLNATSDLSTSKVQFYTTGAGVLVTAAESAGGTAITAVGTTFDDDTPFILRSVANDTYERLFVDSADATSITTTANTVNALAIGDVVYPLTPSGSIPVGNATKEINAAGSAIFAGAKNRPVYVEITGTSACQVNLISGTYSD